MVEEKKGNMKNIADIMEIIHEKYTCIPLLQRNYKWTRECAAELAEDLWRSYQSGKPTYQLNMITIYNNKKDNSLQILDGQQRLITLKLLLSILNSGNADLNYDFERDNKIDERNGRRYFINHILRTEFRINDVRNLSVDVNRLWENYSAMIVPLSFRTIYEFYCNTLNDEKQKGANEDIEKAFRCKLSKIIKGCLRTYIKSEITENIIGIDDVETSQIFQLCKSFQERVTKRKSDDEICNDEIREAEISDQFQTIWQNILNKESGLYKEGYYKCISNLIEDKENVYQYILKNVEMLYHETYSEPIDEFLNINQNKTRFVISDYIRALMISDNSIEDGISDEEREKRLQNRDDTLSVFSKISEYFYSEKYSDIWDIIKVRYDDFEKNPDINRLKVVFCDKYIGTSTKGYEFRSELNRLNYFKFILERLAYELGVGVEATPGSKWNTYNAVKMLLECKTDYRFFSLFTGKDIESRTELNDVTAREKFCYFEEAYRLSNNSQDLWDVSYFLESQLYENKCEVEKSNNLPKIKQSKESNVYCDEWCYVCRGGDNDELNTMIRQMIESKKGEM